MIEYINIGIGYAKVGLEATRNFLMKITAWLPWSEELSVMIVFLATSLVIGHFIAKKFVTRPLQLPYLLWFLVISVSIFLNLMYL
jgi:hypothetical protein